MIRFIACTLLLSLAACGTPSAPAPTPPTPTPTTKTVNDIVLTPTQLSLPLTTFDAGPYPMHSIMVGNNIYFGNVSNSAKPQFFTRYSLSSNTFSPALAVSSNVCGCGYSSRLVSDGANILYIANDATKYTASAGTWTPLNYPATARDNAGEAGAGYHNGNVYFVGGRTPSTLFKYYNISQDAWYTAPNYLYPTNMSQVSSYKDRLYVLGGTGAANKMSYFSTTTSTWTALTDTPTAVSTSYDRTLSAVVGDNLYLLQSNAVHIYDLIKNVWATTPVAISGLPGYANLFSDGQSLYVTGKNASNVPAVFKIAVSLK